MTGTGAPSGTFWGMLVVLCPVPFLGAAIGGAMGAWSGCLVEVRIADDFLNQGRQEITPARRRCSS